MPKGRQALEIYSVLSHSDVDAVKALGFDQVVVRTMDVAQYADSLALKVVFENWWMFNTTWDTISGVVSAAQGIKNLASIKMIDEPIYYEGLLYSQTPANQRAHYVWHYPAPLYEQWRTKIKAQWPNTVLAFAEYGPKADWGDAQWQTYRQFVAAVDEVRVNSYPWLDGTPGNHPLRQVYDWIALARQTSAENQRPMRLVATLQTWSEGDQAKPEFPTIPELRAMSYAALLSDVVGFFDFNDAVWKLVPGFMTDFPKLVAELAAVRDRIAGRSITSTINAGGIVDANVAGVGQFLVNLSYQADRSSGLAPLGVQVP